MDAASHGGVDHARDLRERATLAPVRDRYKIFIIDEAHMVTREGFNALLKIVEEPPEHVKFIFATTEPNKVLGTIRSRTHHYPFRLVPPEVLLPYLQSLCDQEQVVVEPGVLQLVIRAGGGSVRDSLSILDQLMAGASSEKGIEYDLAVALLGYTHAQLLDEVVEALGAKEASTLFGAVSRVVATGQDPRRFVEDLLERLRDLIVVKAVPQSAAQILQGVPQDQLNRLAVQAQALSERELTLAAGTVNDALNGMTGASNPQLQLELLCARLLLPVAEGSANGAEIAALASRLQVLERRVAAGGSAPASAQPGSQAPAGMSAARAAGMAAAGLTPKTQAPKSPVAEAQAPVQEAAAQQTGLQQGGSQQAGAGAPPLAGAPLSSAPLAPAAQAPVAQETVSQAPATQTPAPLASPAQAGAPLAGTAPAAAPNASAPAASAPVVTTPPAPLKLNPNDPLAAVQGNWRAILNRMSVPGSAEQLAQVYPARMEGTVLYVRADIATLRAVKGYVPELTARVSEFLRGPVTIHAEVVKPGEPLNPGAPAPQQEAQPSAPAPQQPAAPLAEGPRGGEDAWRRHGQPVNDAAAPASTSVDAPLGAWDVAPIPQSEEVAPATPVEPSPAEPFPAQVPPAQPAPSSPAGPLSQPGPDAPAGGFGERDSFAASGSGVPHEAPGRSDAQEPPFEDEPHYDAEPAYAEPPYAEPAEVAAPSEAPAEERAAHPAPAGPLAHPAVPETVAPETPAVTPAAEPVAPAGPLAGGPLAAGPLAAGPLAPAPTNESVAEPVPPTEPASSEVVPAKPVHVVTEEDYISEDDEKVENSTFIGLRAIEKIIGGTVIDERPLHQG